MSIVKNVLFNRDSELPYIAIREKRKSGRANNKLNINLSKELGIKLPQKGIKTVSHFREDNIDRGRYKGSEATNSIIMSKGRELVCSIEPSHNASYTRKYRSGSTKKGGRDTPPKKKSNISSINVVTAKSKSETNPNN